MGNRQNSLGKSISDFLVQASPSDFLDAMQYETK